MKTVTTSVGFQDPLGNLVTSGKLILTLSQAAEVTSGGGLIAPKVVVLPLDAVTAKIASTQIYFNDELTPTGTTYGAELLDSGGNIIADFGEWSITGASADLSTMVPTAIGGALAAGVVLTAPALTQTIVQPSGTNLFINRFENIRFADQFAGATADVKIAAAIADLPSTGGFVDARGFGATTQTIAATVTVGTATKPVTLVCNPATTYVAGGVNVDMFSIGPNGQIDNLTVNNTSLATYSGNVVKFIGQDTDGQRKILTNFVIINGTTASPIQTGTAILLQAILNTSSQAWVNVTNGSILGFANGILLSALGTPGNTNFVNGNRFENIVVSRALIAYNLVSNTGDVLGNQFINCDVEFPLSGGGTGIATTCPGGSNVAGNMFTNCNLWDYNGGQTAVSWAANTRNNWFVGQTRSTGGTVLTDNGSLNNTWDMANNQFGNPWVWNLSGHLRLNFAANVKGLNMKVPSGEWTIQVNADNSLGFTIVGVAEEIRMLNTAIFPVTAGALSLGLLANPWSSAFIGAAATNNIQVTGTATGSRVFTLQDQTGTGVVRTGSTSQKTESAADTNVLTVTPLAQAGLYRVSFMLSVSAANTATLGWTATWTDSNGNAQAPTNLALSQTGVAAPALTFTTSAAGNYYGNVVIDTNNAAVNIVVKLTFSGTSFTAKASATVERLI